MTTKTESQADTVRRLVELVVEHNLAEIDLEQDGVRINIKSAVSAPAQPAVSVVAATPLTAHAAQTPPQAQGSPERSGLVAVESPFTGMFYRSPSPEDPAFVHVGDIVRKGQFIGVIEAMKVFSEIPSEHSGRVAEIVAENGKLVQQGEPLMYLEPL